MAALLAVDLRARDAAVALVPFRAGALVVLRALPFTVLRAGALVDFRAGARVVLRVVFRVALRAVALRAGALRAVLRAFVVLRAGALVALRTVFRAFAVLRAGALVVLRAALVVLRAVVRPVARDFLASDFDVLDADLLAFLARLLPRRWAVCLALPVAPATRFSAAEAAFLMAVIESPIAFWRPSPSSWCSHRFRNGRHHRVVVSM